jgi:hypothetical protein
MKIKKKALSTLIILVIALIAFGAARYLGFARTRIGSFSNLRDKYNMYEWTASYADFSGTLQKAVFPKADYMGFDVKSASGSEHGLNVTVKCGNMIVFEKEGITNGTYFFPVYGRAVITIRTEGFLGSFYTISTPQLPKDAGNIYLYGEEHGNTAIIDGEFELWDSYYHNDGMRDLFMELPYFTAEYLNVWMQSDNDDILYEVYDDIDGTQVHTESFLEFLKKIKDECPETVFHGTDVGHQHATTGQRYISYLLENGYDESSYEYVTAVENMDQGSYYQRSGDEVYRENMMAQNFITEYERIFGRDIMGIYGSAHTIPDGMDYKTGKVPCMANRLNDFYGGTVICESLLDLKYEAGPLSSETIVLNGKEYTASYFGSTDLSAMLPDYSTREVWRIEDAYEDLKDVPTTDNVLPYDNYPVRVEAGQVFKLVYTMKDGSVITEYHRSDGDTWNGREVTNQIQIG